jgi:hypothetical protein
VGLALLLSSGSESSVFVSVGGDASKGRHEDGLHPGSRSVSGGQCASGLGPSRLGLVVKGDRHVEKAALSLASGILERR